MKAITRIAPVFLLVLAVGGSALSAPTRPLHSRPSSDTPGQITPPPPPRAPEPPEPPVMALAPLAEQMDEYRALMAEASGGYLGVEIEDVSADTVKELKLREERGVLIRDVREDSPASKAGLKARDVIVGFNGQRVEGLAQFSRLLRETPTGRPVSLSVIRDGREQEIKATLGSRRKEGHLFDPEIHVEVPSIPADSNNWPNSLWTYSSRGRLGVQVQPLSEQLGEYFGVDGKHGLLVSSVIHDSPAAKAGIRAGDVIVSIDGKKVDAAGSISESLRGKEGDVSVTIFRDRQRQTIKVTLEAPQSWRMDKRKTIRPRVNVVRIGPTL